MIISIWAAKGGTAKTTTANMLAFNPDLPFLERFLVDLDPQGGGTKKFTGLASLPPSWRGTTNFLLQFAYGNEGKVPDDVIVSVEGQTVFMRADRYLGALDEFWPKRGAVRQPYEALKACLQSLDAHGADTLTILDCPPGSAYSLLPKAALLASEYVIIPVSPESLSLGGLIASIEDLRVVREGDPATGRPPLNPQLKILGVLRTKVSRRDGVSRAILQALPKLLENLGPFGGTPIRLLETEIRQRVSVQRCNLNNTSVFQGVTGDALDDAIKLGQEISSLLGRNIKGGE